MDEKINRRRFIGRTSAACMGGCLLWAGTGTDAGDFRQDEPIDPEKLCYCSYSCPGDCKFYIASVEDDPELKQEAFDEWDLAGRHGLGFDPEKIFCFRCKPGDMPEGPVLTHCTVRQCAMEKGYQACIQCDELAGCDKELWSRFPEFYQSVLKMRERYLARG